MKNIVELAMTVEKSNCNTKGGNGLKFQSPGCNCKQDLRNLDNSA